MSVQALSALSLRRRHPDQYPYLRKYLVRVLAPDGANIWRGIRLGEPRLALPYMVAPRSYVRKTCLQTKGFLASCPADPDLSVPARRDPGGYNLRGPAELRVLDARLQA